MASFSDPENCEGMDVESRIPKTHWGFAVMEFDSHVVDVNVTLWNFQFPNHRVDVNKVKEDKVVH